MRNQNVCNRRGLKLIARIAAIGVLSLSTSFSYSQAVIYDVTASAYGAKCDGVTDDTTAFNSAIAAAGSTCTASGGSTQARIDLPMGKSCLIKSALTVNAACVGVRGNGASLLFSALSSGAAVTVTQQSHTQVAVNYPGTWENFHIVGPGPSVSGTIGLLVETPANVFQKIDVNGFNTGVQFGNNAYLDSFSGITIWNTVTGVSCPGGLSNSGENITFNQGSISNGTTAINNIGQCEINANEVSFDGLSGSVYWSYGGSGQLRCVNCHVEYFEPTVSPVFDIGGCNAWTSVDFEGGRIQSDWSTSSPNVLALIRNNPSSKCGGSGSWAYFSRTFLAGFSPSSTCAAGAGDYCVVGSNSGQVRMDLSTTGDGGGTFGNAHIP